MCVHELNSGDKFTLPGPNCARLTTPRSAGIRYLFFDTIRHAGNFLMELDDFRQRESRIAPFKAESYAVNVSNRLDPIDEQ